MTNVTINKTEKQPTLWDMEFRDYFYLQLAEHDTRLMTRIPIGIDSPIERRAIIDIANPKFCITYEYTFEISGHPVILVANITITTQD